MRPMAVLKEFSDNTLQALHHGLTSFLGMGETEVLRTRGGGREQ
jgi:hypothetical protein